MCKPVIAQDGYDSGLMLHCVDHKTHEPVVDADGVQSYTVDILQHLDMLAAHRKKYERE